MYSEQQKQYSQRHFTIVEIDLPAGFDGFGTPKSGSGNEFIHTYRFGYLCPLLPVSNVHNIIQQISLKPPELQSGLGLSTRFSGSIILSDKKGDPKEYGTALDSNVINSSSWLAKFAARNILTNAPVRVIDYISGAGLENGRVKHYLCEALTANKNGTWTLKLKDQLSKIDLSESLWPNLVVGQLQSNLSDSASSNSFVKDSSTNYSIGDVIKIGAELMEIEQFTGSITTVKQRGTPIVKTNQLSTTLREDHTSGSSITICEISDNEKIHSLLYRILIDSGIDAAFLPVDDWQAEIDQWKPNARINHVWHEQNPAADHLESILKQFTLEMWFDEIDNKVKVSAISAWKESSITLKEGDHINANSVTQKDLEKARATTTYVVHEKPNKVLSDEIQNYKRSKSYTRSDLVALFNDDKVIDLGMFDLVDDEHARIAVNRYGDRFTEPFEISWQTDENRMTFRVGEVVEVVHRTAVDFAGNLKRLRCQITKIQPVYKNGRSYMCRAIVYQPFISDESEIVITGTLSNINLYAQYAGGPAEPVNLTFVFDAATIGSPSALVPAIRCGSFASGSKLTIIFVNGTYASSKGGNGGDGNRTQTLLATKGGDGGVVFDCDGVDCDFYLSGSTTNSNYPDSDGYILAPSGGDGGFNVLVDEIELGSGGNGGNGLQAGAGGKGYGTGRNGNSGTSAINANYGVDGAANDAGAGLAGYGIITQGANINIYDTSGGRYVAGRGDN